MTRFWDEISARLAELTGTASPEATRAALNEFDTRDIQAVRVSEGGGGDGGSSAFRQITLDIEFDTPGLVIPETGPAGILVGAVAEFEQLMATSGDSIMQARVFTAWDGSSPQLNFCTTAGRGNLPGTPPTPFLVQTGIDQEDTDDTSTGAFQSAGNNFPNASIWFTPATSLYVYVDDGAGADPESMQGVGQITLLIRAAP